MKNRLSTKVLPNGALRYGVYGEDGTFLRYEYYLPADEPIEPGTPINTASLLKDATAARLGLTPDAVPDDALNRLADRTESGWKLLNFYTVPGSYTFTFPSGISEIGVIGIGGGGAGGVYRSTTGTSGVCLGGASGVPFIKTFKRLFS